jgi:hypothetical protein
MNKSHFYVRLHINVALETSNYVGPALLNMNDKVIKIKNIIYKYILFHINHMNTIILLLKQQNHPSYLMIRYFIIKNKKKTLLITSNAC